MADGFDGPERPTMPAPGPAPQSEFMDAVEAVAEKTAARFLDRIQGFIDEDRRAIVEQFNADLDIRDAALLTQFTQRQDLALETYLRAVRKLRDDITAFKIERELAETPEGKAEDVRVLVADDEPAIQLNLRRLFESRAMTVFTAGDAEAAMRVLDVEPIDVVLSDERMPKNGERLHEYVRTAHPGCELILMTGAEESEAIDRVLESGAFNVLTKPFSVARAVLYVTRAAEHGRLRRRGLAR